MNMQKEMIYTHENTKQMILMVQMIGPKRTQKKILNKCSYYYNIDNNKSARQMNKSVKNGQYKKEPS